MNTIKNTTDVLNWIKDVDDGDFISSPGYSPDYFGFSSISVDELNIIVVIVNSLLILDDSKVRVCWVSGEIRLVTDKDRIYTIDEEIKNDIQLYLFVELSIKEKK